MPVKNRIAEMQPEVSSWRHYLHSHPELRFDLPETTSKVVSLLKEFGVDEITQGVGRSGIVAVINGRKIDSGHVIGFRADMDALPISEISDLEYVSKNHGKMHACGHDGHTSILLGAAKYLTETRNFNGKVVLIFQPAEEGGGGALAMVRDGVMEQWNVDEIYGLHNMPNLPVGNFAIRTGPLLAASDFFEIEVRGKGGHGAMPHQANDTTLATAAIIMALQQIISREVPALKSAVVSVTGIQTETMAHNVIPATARLTGTARFLDKKIQAAVVDRMREVILGTAKVYGCSADFDYQYAVDVTENEYRCTEHAISAAQRVAGIERVDSNIEPLMGGEDFSEMLKVRPGAFIFLGNGDSAMLHHPEYNFNDEAIPNGISWFVELAEQRMPT
jgi:amidohydrolase